MPGLHNTGGSRMPMDTRDIHGRDVCSWFYNTDLMGSIILPVRYTRPWASILLVERYLINYYYFFYFYDFVISHIVPLPTRIIDVIDDYIVTFARGLLTCNITSLSLSLLIFLISITSPIISPSPHDPHKY